MKMASRTAVLAVWTKLLRHHFAELSWTLLPNHGLKAILVLD